MHAGMHAEDFGWLPAQGITLLHAVRATQTTGLRTVEARCGSAQAGASPPACSGGSLQAEGQLPLLCMM